MIGMKVNEKRLKVVSNRRYFFFLQRGGARKVLKFFFFFIANCFLILFPSNLLFAVRLIFCFRLSSHSVYHA